jgi:magnesium-transporting ATPase (P-type)
MTTPVSVQTNNRLATVTTYGADGRHASSDAVRWRDIKVGDYLLVQDKQPLPADVVVLYTSEDENIAYIETSQIDGETNLKLRRAIPVLTHGTQSSDEALPLVLGLRGSLECEGPNVRINSFTGVYRPEEGAAVPIDVDNVILRGSMVRNTRWVLALVVYTGDDTKLQVRHRWTSLALNHVLKS